jgi:hypothetical protein
MKFHRTLNQIGCDEIYISDLPPNEKSHLIVPKKKPYIIFIMDIGLPIQDKIQKKIEYFQKTYLMKFGTIDRNIKQFVLTVSGYKNVVQAIKLFTQQENCELIYPYDKNYLNFLQLEQFKIKCEDHVTQMNKPKRMIPSRSKLDEKFVKIEGAPTYNSSNVTYRVRHTKSEIEYVFKVNMSKRAISEFEVFNALCYQVLLDDRHPNVIAVHNNSGEFVGIASELIPEFKSLHDYFKDIQCVLFKPEQYTNHLLGKSDLKQSLRSPSLEILLKGEIVKVWAAAYTQCESDLHGGNVYFGIDNFFGKIDDDRSSIQYTAKYHSIDPEKGSTILGYSAPVDAFRVTERDILNFPKLLDAKPKNWPDRSDNNLIQFDELIQQEKYINDKYYMFLKRILVPDETYQQIVNIASSSEKRKNQMLTQQCQKTKELEKVLVNMSEFQSYVLSHLSAVAEICDEFERINKKQKKFGMSIDIGSVNRKFNVIHQTIKEAVEHEQQSELVTAQQKKNVTTEYSIFRVGLGYKKTGYTMSSILAFTAILFAIQSYLQSTDKANDMQLSANILVASIAIAALITFCANNQFNKQDDNQNQELENQRKSRI